MTTASDSRCASVGIQPNSRYDASKIGAFVRDLPTDTRISDNANPRSNAYNQSINDAAFPSAIYLK